MTDPVLDKLESGASLDAGEILRAAASTVASILDLRSAGLTSKDVRREVEELIATLPADLDAAKGATDAIRTKGSALFVIGDNRKAVRWLERAGKDATTRQILGHALMATGRYEAAAEVLEEVSKDEPAARLPLVEALLRATEATKARKLVRRFGKAVRESAEGRYLTGYLHELDGEYEDAYGEYRAVLELDGRHSRAMFRLAYMLDLDGNEDDAVEMYERVRLLKPTFTNALINLGVLYEDRGEYTKAVDVYQEILDINPNHPRARQFMADAKASLNMYYDEDLERTEDRRAQILRIPITDFELSVRSRNCLAKMQIETLGDLIKRTEHELLTYKNFGETSLQEIKDILAQKGLRLGMGRDEQKASVQAAARTLLGIEPEKGDVMTKSIEDLELSVRSRNAMSVLAVVTLGDLTRLSEKDLMQVKNFGQTSMNEVKEKLAEFGLALAESEA